LAHFFQIKAYPATYLPKFSSNLHTFPLTSLKKNVCTSILGAIF